MNHEPQTWADLQDTGNAQSHLVLQAVARHADWDTGRCYPSAHTLARMAKCSIKTVRRHLSRLEGDGFLVVDERKREDGSQASNLITLSGYAEWIAAAREGGQIARPRRASKYRDEALGTDDDAPPEPPNHGVDNLTTPLVTLTTPLAKMTRGPGQQVTTREHLPEQEDYPLIPKGEKVEDFDLEDQQGTTPQSKKLIQALTDWGKHHSAVRHLLIPILTARRFSATDALGDLQELAAKGNDLPAPLLAKAADLVLAGPKTVKTARVRDAIAAVRRGGLMVPLRQRANPGQWQAWLAHFARTNPPVARLMGRSVSWQVPAEWPPSHDARSAILDAPGDSASADAHSASRCAAGSRPPGAGTTARVDAGAPVEGNRPHTGLPSVGQATQERAS